jgi:hypothetical protein
MSALAGRGYSLFRGTSQPTSGILKTALGWIASGSGYRQLGLRYEDYSTQLGLNYAQFMIKRSNNYS